MKKTLLIGLIVLCFSHVAIGQVTDKLDGKTYKTVIIGTQEWMAENLHTFYFCNGDPIPVIKNLEDWVKAKNNSQPACCYYENNGENGEKYGLLYNWYAVNDPRGLSPEGWHLPSDAEWTTLTDYLGGEKVAGTKMKSTTGWYSNGNGTNESGFSGLPGGYRNFVGYSNYVGPNGGWWSSTQVYIDYAWGRILYYNSSNVGRVTNYKGYGFSVRCIKD